MLQWQKYDKFKIILKEAVGYYPGICTERLRKIMKTSIKIADVLPETRNERLQKYESRALSLEQG
jgi:hypothetical protein